MVSKVYSQLCCYGATVLCDYIQRIFFSIILNGKPVIVVGLDHQRLLCKELLIVSSFLPSLIQQIFTAVSVGEISEEVSTASLQSAEGDKHRILEHHHRSLTGITPTASKGQLQFCFKNVKDQNPDPQRKGLYLEKNLSSNIRLSYRQPKLASLQTAVENLNAL